MNHEPALWKDHPEPDLRPVRDKLKDAVQHAAEEAKIEAKKARKLLKEKRSAERAKAIAVNKVFREDMARVQAQRAERRALYYSVKHSTPVGAEPGIVNSSDIKPITD